MSDERFKGWAILELMGHRRLGGWVEDVEMFGARMVRIDVPGPDAEFPDPALPIVKVKQGAERGFEATQFYSPAAVYGLTPTTGEIALAVARANRPQPVQRWELPALPPPEVRTPDDPADDDEDEDEDDGRPF